MESIQSSQEQYKVDIHELISSITPKFINNNEKQCFNSLYVGSNAMSYSEGSPDANALSSFRDFILHRANKKWNIDINSYINRIKQPNILMVVKDIQHAAHPTIISNFVDAYEKIKSAFPDLQIKTLKWYGMTQKQQIEIMQDTDILYSQPGSDVMPALFMPTGSTLVTPCRAYDRKWVYGKKSVESEKPQHVVFEYGNEVRIWFNTMPYMRSFQVCGDNDIVFDKNVYNVPAIINLDNLVNTMTIAINDWKQRKGQA